MQHIIVTKYNQNWSSLFQQEAEKIKIIFGNECVHCYHIGSTAVEGMLAKPIIDILLVVRDIKGVDSQNEKLKQIGYECMGNTGSPTDGIFAKEGMKEPIKFMYLKNQIRERLNVI